MVWQGEATGVVNVQEMTFKIREWYEGFVICFSASKVSIESLVRSSIKAVVVATTNCSFQEICVSEGDTSVIAVSIEEMDAFKV